MTKIAEKLGVKLKDMTGKGLVLLLQGLGFAWFIGFIMFCVAYPYQQIVNWLKTGNFPPRDLYFSLADVKCAATGWKAEGFQGMEICRQTYIEFTDWVGINRILNWFCDVHVGILYIGISALAFCILVNAIENYESTINNK